MPQRVYTWPSGRSKRKSRFSLLLPASVPEMDQTTTNATIFSIAKYGDRYIKEYVEPDVRVCMGQSESDSPDKDALRKQWYPALCFFFRKSFYRGRRDELSHRFEKAALGVLDNFGGKAISPGFNEARLMKALRDGGVNNHIDRKMVVGTIKVVFEQMKPQNNNIVEYALRAIQDGTVEQAFEHLTSVYGVGDKLASMFLRDIALIYELEPRLSRAELRFVQPIDTWVRKVAEAIKLVPAPGRSNEAIKDAIITECQKARVSSLLFNAGAWMAGSKSFELLIENLCRVPRSKAWDL
jgi:hypothetical protein